MIPAVIRWRLLVEAAQNTLFYCLFPFMVLYLTQAWGAVQSSLALAVISIFGVLAGILSGVLSDRFGRRPLIITVGIGFLLAMILYLTGRSFDSVLTVYISFAIMSVAYSLYLPAGRAYVADWLDEQQQKRVYTLSYQIFNIAVILGPLLGSFIYKHVPLWFTFTSITGALLILGASLWATPECRNVDRKDRPKRTGYFQAVTLIWRDSRLLFFVIGSVLAGQAFMQLEILVPAQLFHNLTKETEFLGFTLTASQYYASLLMANGLLVACLGTFAANLSAKYSTKFGFVASSLLYAVSMGIFSISSNLIMYAAGVLVLTVAELLVVSIQDAYIANIAPPDQKGQYFAGANIRYSLSRIAAPQILALAPLVGYRGSFLIAAAFSVISAFAFMQLFNGRLEHRVSRLNEVL